MPAWSTTPPATPPRCWPSGSAEGRRRSALRSRAGNVGTGSAFSRPDRPYIGVRSDDSDDLWVDWSWRTPAIPGTHQQLLDGDLYHAYNRFARGEEIFAEPDEADRFVSMIRKAKKRDGFIIYAWCLRKDQATTRLREQVAPVGIERWGHRPGELGRVLGKHPDVVTRWARMAALRRADDLSLVDHHEALDGTIAAQAAEAEAGGS